MRLHIEALNHAVRNIDADRLRMHMCWGNYPGPHHCDVPFADIIDVLALAKPTAILFEAANPRHAHEWKMFESVKPPEGKVMVPGVIEMPVELHRASRNWWPSASSATPICWAAKT